MHYKIIILLVLTLSNSFADNEYWLVDEYINHSFKEKANSEKFTTIVRNDGEKINKQNHKVDIFMVYPGDQISDYWRRSKISFEKRLKELNIEYELIDHFTKPGTIREQARHLMKAINSKHTDYVVFTLDAKKHSKFIEVIINRKKPKLILQNITTPLKKWGEIQPFLYVGFDHKIGSIKIADYYINKTKGKGKYAVLYGTQGYVSRMRGDEFIKYVKKGSDLKLVDSYYTDFNENKAYKATKEIIKKNKDIKFIYACSTDIAHGAIKALKESSLSDKVMVNGWGGGSTELSAIEKKEMELTVMRINDDNGVAMAEAIKFDIQNRADEIPLIFSGDMILVKKGINGKRLNSLKKKAFRYSN